MLVWSSKDPDEIAKRDVDWSLHPSWRPGDSIGSATFSLSTAAGMSITDSTDDGDTFSTVTLSGGDEDERGKVLCEVATNDGQTLQVTATILLRSR